MRNPLIFVDDVVGGWPKEERCVWLRLQQRHAPASATREHPRAESLAIGPVPIYMYTRHTTSSLWKSRQLNVAGEEG